VDRDDAREVLERYLDAWRARSFRDLEGDIGHGNALAFFDFPGLDVGDYQEVLGGLHHLAISVPPDRWERLKAKLDGEGIDYAHIDGSSIYFRDPDGTRVELISDPLGEMYGYTVGEMPDERDA
jgi:catechol 2,3-dioxygenase-like lactoylglutathione lyase family enzyme